MGKRGESIVSVKGETRLSFPQITIPRIVVTIPPYWSVIRIFRYRLSFRINLRMNQEFLHRSLELFLIFPAFLFYLIFFFSLIRFRLKDTRGKNKISDALEIETRFTFAWYSINWVNFKSEKNFTASSILKEIIKFKMKYKNPFRSKKKIFKLLPQADSK